MAMRFTLPSIIRTPARRSAAGRGLPLALAWLALVPWCLTPAGRAAEEAGTKPRVAYERTPYALPSESKFEVNDQHDCGNRGLTVTGFAAVDMSSGGKTLRFALP